jgi:ketosteroid isomerase-like protein
MTLTADDRLDITALYARQVWALDTGDVDGYVDTFTDDAVLDLAERHTGKAAIRQFAELFRLHDVGVPGSQHLVTSLLLDGDGAHCSVRAYVTRTHRLPGRGRNNCQIIWSGYYADTAVKVNGTWLIQEQRGRAWEGDVLEPINRARG